MEATIDSTIDSLIASKDYRKAFETLLDEPPVTSKDQTVKDGHGDLILKVFDSMPESTVLKVVDSLTAEDRGFLLKYVFKFMKNESTTGSRNINYTLMLKLHAKLVEMDGIGSIVRVMADRKTV